MHKHGAAGEAIVSSVVAIGALPDFQKVCRERASSY